MTTNVATSEFFVSPFLLPYLRADAEDFEQLASTALEGSPSDTFLYSPSEEVRHERSSSGNRPGSNAEPSSPSGQNRSVIEASVSELLFDPNLTFLDSPSPEKRAGRSLTGASGGAAIDPVFSLFGLDQPPASSDASKAPRNYKSDKLFSEEVKSSVAKRPMAESIGDERIKRSRLKRDRVEEDLPIQPETKSLKQAEKLEVSPKRVAKDKRDIGKGVTTAEPSETTIRKSPRFASKVINPSEPSILHVCQSCRRGYKRVRDFEKHVAACGK